MIKAKEASLTNIVMFLVLSVAMSAGLYFSKSHSVDSRSLPVFMGEEVLVQKAARNIPAAKILSASNAKTKAAEKAAVAPAPLNSDPTPLPIIPPSISFKVLPVYPSSALEKNLTGTVLLSVYVGLNGQPEKIETKTSSGVAELDRSAITAVGQWKFSPAMQGSTPLASWFEVPVRFRID